MSQSFKPTVAVAVPVLNEEDVVSELIERLSAVLDQIPRSEEHRIVVVDDGSSDRTLEILEAIAMGDPRVVVGVLSRNFGHQAALTAALDLADGDIVVLMDGDLQDPPEAIPLLISRLAEGFDIAYAVRTSREEGLLLRTAYRLHYRLLNAVSHVPLPVDSGDFCALSRRVADEIRAMGERRRYLRGLRSWVGFRQVGVPVPRERRAGGTSKYSLRRLFALAFDGLFSFSVWPIRASIVLGGVAVSAAAVYALYAVAVLVSGGQTPRGFTALLVATVFMSGVSLFFLGVIGEYVARIYDEVKSRPLYVLDRVVTSRARDRFSDG